MKKIKALVVDDSAYNRTAISKMLASDADIEVVGSAVDGVDAIAKTLRLLPDVITLDLEMPNMDGFTFLRWLMKERPTPAIVLSSRSDSRSVFRALEVGAVDFIAKPEARISRSIEAIHDDLLTKVHAVMNTQMSRVKNRRVPFSIRRPSGLAPLIRISTIAMRTTRWPSASTASTFTQPWGHYLSRPSAGCFLTVHGQHAMAADSW